MSHPGPPQGPPLGGPQPFDPPTGRPLGPPPAAPPRPSGQGVEGRVVAGVLLLVAAASVFVIALVLVHGSATVAFTGSGTTGETTRQVTSDIRCVAAGGGTEGYVETDGDDSDAYESDYVRVGDPGRGLDPGQANLLCDRARDARITHATELGFVGLFLTWGGVAVLRRRT